MPVAALSDITDWITEVVGNHGLYAVFLLMLVDAVFPAASELVMVYAGAIASGAIAGQSVSLFGHDFESGLPAYLAMAIAGTLGYLVGAIIGWGAGDYLGRPWLERHGRWLHLNTEKLDRAERWFDRLVRAVEPFDTTVTFCFTPEHMGIAPHHTSPPRENEAFAEWCGMMIRRYAPGRALSAPLAVGGLL